LFGVLSSVRILYRDFSHLLNEKRVMHDLKNKKIIEKCENLLGQKIVVTGP
jgi:hypothetical protein